MYDFSVYTADELATLISATADQIATFKRFAKLTRADREQIAHDEAMLCEAIDALMRRDPT